MTSKADEQRERERVLHNDELVREQAGTFMSHTHSDVGGRFSAVGAQTVVGAEPITNYPAAAAHQRDPMPDEPPLGYRIDELEPMSPLAQADPELTHSPVQATGEPTSGAPSTPHSPGVMSEHVVGSPPFNNKLDRRF